MHHSQNLGYMLIILEPTLYRFRSSFSSHTSSIRHSAQRPYQCLLAQYLLFAAGGMLVDVGTFAVVGDGSTQMKPNHSLLLQSSVAVAVCVFFGCDEVDVGFGAAEVVV